ncbi:bifunctional 3'-5' exonuclease/DNA polymerase [Glutamicibacter sp.]|uniref:bifunctional 3'-5' exonuclease/DNA polymerase n=1 Tax=Glutamicibacter sp. TaxID=1931995 RepID=UPI0028BDA7B1|nr:bifunctional 3'-5' exonuclease/DNA polymerase [Glutamicibacter sp.]
MPPSTPGTLAFIAADPEGFASIELRAADSGAALGAAVNVTRQEFCAAVQQLELAHSPRWVMLRTSPWCELLTAQNVYLAKAHVLSLAQRILHRSPAAGALEDYDLERAPAPSSQPEFQDALFSTPASGESLDELVAMYAAQRAALPADPVLRAKLQLLLNAESIGAVIASEMENTGLAWDEAAHRALLREQLGPRVAEHQRPAKLAALAAAVGAALNTPGLNPDSPQELLRALHRAGFAVQSVRAWELEAINHPSVAKVLEYKKLSRLASTHGDAWLDQWVSNGRFHPHYVLGTVASGRWAASGGGALQLPHSIRQVVRAPAGSTFVVADGRQLEPRILAAISQDANLQKAGAQDDLYQWLIDAQLVKDRRDAKLGMLSVIYGGSAGGSAAVGAALKKNFGAAMNYVDSAARAGERGEGVHSFLGRGCPPADERWMQAQRSTRDEASQRAADAAARSRGRFTRNFVVQSTAAEWALIWMGHARHLIHQAGYSQLCRQVFFVHDEIVFECPVHLAEELAGMIRAAAALAGRTLFGAHTVNFPVSIAVTANYAEAK